MTKAQWRRWAKDLPVAADVSRELCARLIALPEWCAARHILLFAPLPGEPDLLPLVLDQTRHFYLPRCGPERTLAVHKYDSGAPLITGPFGLREPNPAVSSATAPAVLDLVVVPSVLLSERCERLGHGAGYYDRFLPLLRPDSTVVGVQPDARVVATLPTDPWDIRLDIVVTEAQIFRRSYGESKGAMV